MVTELEVTEKVAALDLNENDDRDEEDDENEETQDTGEGLGAVEEVSEGADGKVKKKKKASKKKKKKPAKTAAPAKAPASRVITGNTEYYTQYGQTPIPTKTVAELFPKGNFPEGLILPHGLTKKPNKHSSREFDDDFDGTKRLTNAEKKEAERILNEETGLYNKVRHAAECHRQVRHYAQSFIQPGIRLSDMCEQIEELNRKLVKENGLQAGIGFPTGCSLNHVAAHYTPNGGDDTVLQYGDVMKVDFGTQIEGRIIDSGEISFLWFSV